MKYRREEDLKILDLDFTNRLRGIAILLIMLSHVAGSFGTKLFTPCGGTGVAIFLFLSGYGLNESYKTYGLEKYWIKKIVRVFLPYFILETIALCFRQEVNVWNYLLDITGIATAYWYIGFLLKQYIAFYVLTRFVPKARIPLMLLFSIFILFRFSNIEAEQAFSFILGVIISAHITKVRSVSPRAICGVAIVSFVVGIVFLALKQLPAIRVHEADYIYNLVQCGIKLPLALSVMSGFYFIYRLLYKRFLAFTGRISYELYLVHMPFYGLVSGSITNALILFLGSFLVATLFYHINKWNAKYLLQYSH